MRILLVDDETLIRMDMRSLLESEGHTIVGEGKNGVEAITLAKELHPDVILMDVKMPELDGIEAARQIGHTKIAPVVLLTAYSQEDLIRKAQDSGVYGYLIKPVRDEQVIPALSMALGRYKEEQKLWKNLEDVTSKLEERKYITQATGILMDLYHISEDEAYRRLRKFSMDKGYTLLATCKAVIKKLKK